MCPGPDALVAVGWDEVLDRLAAEALRVYGGPGPEAVFGGSYGWSAPGASTTPEPGAPFLNCLGGYVRSLNTYSVGTSGGLDLRPSGRPAGRSPRGR
jgi:biotin/methionine sulfoxide reductase